MRALAVIVAALCLAGCGAGSIGMSFEAMDAAVQTGAPGTEVTVTGTFETKGAFNGRYTLTATPGDGVSSCLVQAGSAPAGTTIHVNSSGGNETFDLTVQMMLAASANSEAVCHVSATGDDHPAQTTSADAAVVVATP